MRLTHRHVVPEPQSGGHETAGIALLLAAKSAGATGTAPGGRCRSAVEVIGPSSSRPPPRVSTPAPSSIPEPPERPEDRVTSEVARAREVQFRMPDRFVSFATNERARREPPTRVLEFLDAGVHAMTRRTAEAIS